MQTSTQQIKRKTGISRLLEIAGKRKGLLFVSVFLALVHVLLSLVPYVLTFYVIREITADTINFATTKTYIIYAIIAVVISMIVYYLSVLVGHIAAYNIMYEMQRFIVEKIGRLPMGFLSNKNSGTLKKIVSDDVERLETFIAHHIPDFIKGITLPLVTLGYLFSQDWRLALVSLLPIAILMIWIPFTYGGHSELMKKYHQALEEMNSGIVEYVRAMPVMKIFGQSADTFRKFGDVVKSYDVFQQEWIKGNSSGFAVFISFATNAMLPVLAFGLWLYFQNGVTLPVLLLFLILGSGYIKPLFGLSGMTTQLTMINKGVQQIDNLLYRDTLPESPIHQQVKEYSIGFDKVTFAYNEENWVLKDVSFHIPEKSITALVGPSGAGKSTIGQLLARFWDVNKGEIKIGGNDIKDYPTDQLMEMVSFVFQDSFMFQQSMYENIRMGMDKTSEEIVAAAKATQIHDLIMSLPKGYDTLFGQAGVHLSGGEQQRIQLARAILKDAPILILDEATAFADPENELKIQDALSKLIMNKTVIIIAHRLSTITDADQIILFEKGNIVASGKHQQLLQNSTLYERMWNAHTRAKEFVI